MDVTTDRAETEQQEDELIELTDETLDELSGGGGERGIVFTGAWD